MLLGNLVEQAARENPDAPALLFEGRTLTYAEVDASVRRAAEGFRALGLGKGDRVALMLPNVPEFVYAFFGAQRLGCVTVPFNTMYKGGEVAHILSDSRARAVVALANFAPLMNEILPDLPELEHVILTGERNVLFAAPEDTVFVQLVTDAGRFESADQAYRRTGEVLLDAVGRLGVEGAWYRHRGSVRLDGRKMAGFVVQQVEDLYIISAVLFTGALSVETFLSVLWVPQEIKDKVLEPIVSVAEASPRRPAWDEVQDAVTAAFEQGFGVRLEAGALGRDELFGYEKLRTQLCKG